MTSEEILWKANSEGYMSAIFRKPEKSNPYSELELQQAWLKGFRRGIEVVKYFTSDLHTRPSTAWFGNYRE